jgi:RecB family endonuclease NucS
MSDIQLFRLRGTDAAAELASHAALLEKTLQTLIEGQMETFLGVRFLAGEYATGKTHRGRIDSLGLDENGCPVIVEYKRHSNENVINQGLFYLDWLLDHQAEFRWLVMEKLGKETAEHIEWAGTRLLCIAADFTRYDQHAVQQIPRNIELIRYKLFGDDLLLLELVNAQSVPDATAAKPAPVDAPPTQQGMSKLGRTSRWSSN